MRWRGSIALSTALIITGCVVPCAAALPAGAQPMLAFGARYRGTDGLERVHHGVDVACDAGDAVTAPLAGTIAFVGRVPAGDGATRLCVTIVSGELRMSLVPFATVEVAEGAPVAAGDRLGTAAGVGDPSSAGPHLHVGLKQAGLYVDPMPWLSAKAPATSGFGGDERPESGPQQAEEGALTPAPDPAPAAGPGPAPAADKRHVRLRAESRPAPVPLGSPLAAGAGHVLPTEREAVPRSGGAEPAGGPAIRRGPTVRPVTARPGMAARQGSNARTGVVPGAPRAARTRRRSASGALGVPALASACAALFGAVLLASRSALDRRIRSHPPASSRLGRLLQQLRAGDTLCGLTSCPGLAPSPSRGRSVQRR